MNVNDRYLTADEGYILTNGEVYGKSVHLGNWDNADNWNEITEEEYNEIMKQQESEVE